MKKNGVSELVGKSFEELSVEDMCLLQGADSAGVLQVSSTPSIMVSISFVVTSGVVSGAVSKAVSTLVTAAAHCA